MKRSSALVLVVALAAAPPLNAGCGDTTSNTESTASGGSGGSISSTAQSSATTTGSSASAASDGGAGGPAGVCLQVSGDYGDCEAALGWGFDGERCQPYSGCNCEPDCDRLFATALDCALTCQGEGHCREAALQSGGIAGPIETGALCDDLEVCTASLLPIDSIICSVWAG